MTDRWRLLPGARRLQDAIAPELPQKDDLCGPIWAYATARALSKIRDADQDRAASLAGTHLWAGEESSLPPGQPSRLDYSLPLPSTSDPAIAGTDTAGVSHAIAALTENSVVVTEYQPAERDWRPESLATFFDEQIVAASPLVVLANLGTEHYLFPDSAAAPEDFLRTGDLSSYRPSPWRVGHFAAILGWRQSEGHRLYLVHDSYPLSSLLGSAAPLPSPYLHEQPDLALCAALRRTSRSPGRLLLIRPAAVRDDIHL